MDEPRAVYDEGIKTEVYGFVALTATLCSYVIYLIWAYVPEPTLHQLGITYYPSKYWAIAAPIYVCVAAFFVGFFYIAFNLIQTAPLDSFDTVLDKHSRIDEKNPEGCIGKDPKEGMPEFGDLNIAVVNHMLYQGKRSRHRASNKASAISIPHKKSKTSIKFN
mmetsp:Transcript_1403/g.1908  ORF Transcript_1403/g.1908 Transcript_1403/m.1908 type:complete len:163 (+) Transcript_1403:149-637(+)